MRRLLKDWDAFWFKPQTGAVLGIYRIAIGLLTIYSFGLFAKDAAVFFSDEGVLRRATLASTVTREYHTILQGIGSPAGVFVALGALFVAALFFTVGLYTRAASIALYVLVVSFHERNNLVLNGGDTVLRTMLFFFMVAPAGAAFSVDALRRKLRDPDAGPLRIRPWAQRMMQIQVAVIYLTTVYAKTRGELYHNGTAMYYVFGLVDFNLRGVEQLMNFPVLVSFLTYGVLLAEAFIPLLLWFRVTRPYAVLLGIFAHGWIMCAMTIPVFGILMLATYIPFFSEEEVALALERLRARFRGRRAKVYFDGACANCRKVRTVVERLDLCGRVESLDARTIDVAGMPHGLTRDVLLREMVLVTPKGRVLLGFDAYRWLTPRLPALCWTLPFWYFPAVAPLGRRIYRLAASTRTVLARCEATGSCPAHPQ